MKAFILAAGFGSRLMPITRFVPKALLPVGRIKLIDFHIENLIKIGIDEIVVNTHYLSDKIGRHIKKSWKKVLKIYVLKEKEILGTGGALRNAKQYLKDNDFILINSDIVYDFDLKSVIKYHKRKKNFITICVRETSNKDLQRVFVRNGYVWSFGKPEGNEKRKLFTGVHIINPGVYKFINEKSFCIISDVYRSILNSKEEKISAFFVRGYWRDVGKLNSYFKLLKDFSSKKLPEIFYKGVDEQSLKRGYISPSAVISETSNIGKDCFIFDRAKVKNNTILNKTIVFESTVISENEKLTNIAAIKNLRINIK